MTYRQPKRVVLHTKAGGLDFSIRGGAEHGLPIVVSSIDAGGLTSQTDLKIGSEILQVNGVKLSMLSHSDAVKLLTQSQELDIVFRRNTLFEKAFATMESPQRGVKLALSESESENELDVDEISLSVSKGPSMPSPTTATDETDTAETRNLMQASERSSPAPSLVSTDHSIILIEDEPSPASIPAPSSALDGSFSELFSTTNTDVFNSKLRLDESEASSYEPVTQEDVRDLIRSRRNQQHRTRSSSGKAHRSHDSRRSSTRKQTMRHELVNEEDLEPGWRAHRDKKTGRVFYANSLLKQTTWLKPTRKRAKAERDVSKVDWMMVYDGWEQATSQSGDIYFICHHERRNTWEHPRIERQKQQLGIAFDILISHQMDLKEREGVLATKRQAGNEGEERLSRMQHRRAELNASIASAGDQDASRLEGQLDMLTEQIQEELTQMRAGSESIATQDSINQRRRERQERVEHLIAEFKASTHKQPIAGNSAKLARSCASSYGYFMNLYQQAASKMSDIEDSRKLLFRQADAMDEYEALSLSAVFDVMGQAQACHLTQDDELRTDFELAIFAATIESVLLPKLTSVVAQLEQLWVKLDKSHRRLQSAGQRTRDLSGLPAWVLMLLEDFAASSLHRFVSTMLSCKPTFEFQVCLHLMCADDAIALKHHSCESTAFA
eukprot:TRINITY_DN6613_c0_g1_i1.p1 TRINITY_DN6613_c0_g1~~TRINITY_DN6613_c0_g1_i1.p1  ORF type:complete len:668 (+),score=121.15 TRINITY_DN6613_c0_g1_i1:193-2196(+)